MATLRRHGGRSTHRRKLSPSAPAAKAASKRSRQTSSPELISSRRLTRRALLFGGVQSLCMAALGGRLYYLQIVEAETYLRLALRTRTDTLALAPERGRILDRHGQALAQNEKNFRVYLIPERSSDIDVELARFIAIVPLSPRRHEEVIRLYRSQPRFVPIPVIDNLDWDQFSRINLHAPEIPGFEPSVGTRRAYPGGRLFAHIVGYVGPPGERDIERDSVYRIPGIEIGRSGVERSFDAALIGKPGRRHVEVDAKGRRRRAISLTEPTRGDDLNLTLDFDIQRVAFDAMGDRNGAVVALDIDAGDILCMVSTPSFDPNLFVSGIDLSSWEKLLGNPHNPLLNKTVSGQYHPGSTIKMAVGAAVLHHKIARPEEKIVCRGQYRFGDRIFRCWKKEGHGAVDFHRAISASCDVYFYETARRLGIDRLHDMARSFGLGAATQLPLANEKAGLAPSPAWKKRALGQPWFEGETLICGIGQSYFLATPIQLALMTAQIAARGAPVRARLILGADEKNPPQRPGIDVSPAIFDRLHLAMTDVVNASQGTAYQSRLRTRGVKMAGKTGTSQVVKIDHDDKERSHETTPWRHRNHALFVGYAPHDAPRYAVAVIVEHGGGGASAAAPVARRIMDFILGGQAGAPAIQA